MINAALTFDTKTNKEILNYFKKLDIIGLTEKSIPHITVLKFEGTQPNIERELEVEFAGLTILPSRKKGYWIEISVLKSEELLSLQEDLLATVGKTFSGVQDRFRPHVTLGKVDSFQSSCFEKILRKKVRAKLTYGIPDGDFEILL